MPFPRSRLRPLAGAVALASATLALSATAAPAQACTEVSVQQAKRARAAQGAAPLVVGDSTLLLAAPKLAARGISADARGCRQFDTGVAILSAHRHDHTLPRLAILALGANGAVTGPQIDRALAVTGPQRVLGLVTPLNSPSTRAAMRRAAQRDPKRVLLIDWAGYAAGHAGWLADGLHPTYPGASAFARFIAHRVQPTVARLRAVR